MINTATSRAPIRFPSQALRGRVFARVVMQRDDPVCSAEAQLQDRGARVTRLLAADLLTRPTLDGTTARLLGRLYEGLIVPDGHGLEAPDIAVAAGVPVVFEAQDLSALVP